MNALTGIYGILPSALATEELLAKAEAALQGGLPILQFRDTQSGFKNSLKRARLLSGLCATYGATFIINDSLQMALESGAQGVHMGREDVGDISTIRNGVPDDFIVGITCRADAYFSKSALQYGANYVSFGAVFPSKTKSDVPVIGLPRLEKAKAMFPEAKVCAIGGINMDNLNDVKATGAEMAAVISSLFVGDEASIKQTAEWMVKTWATNP